jgi:hypothetical protein
MATYHTFTGLGTLPVRFKTSGRYSEIILGEVGDNFPSRVTIMKVNQKGTLSPLRVFTEAPTNLNVLLETEPGSSIDIEVTGPLYVEINDLDE